MNTRVVLVQRERRFVEEIVMAAPAITGGDNGVQLLRCVLVRRIFT